MREPTLKFAHVKPRPGAHVVCADGATAHCLHCDRKYTMALPCPLSVWCAAMNEFVRLHLHCQPRPA